MPAGFVFLFIVFKIIKIFEQRQTFFEKLFIRFAVVGALPCAFAAARSAKFKIFTAGASVWHFGTSAHKTFCGVAECNILK